MGHGIHPKTIIIRRSAVGFGFAALLATGCSGPAEVAVYPVVGQVVVNGKPAEGATVVFHPQAAGEVAELRPTGKTDADGRFKLTTRESNDGAPAGDYKVTINWAKSDIKPGQPAEDAKVIRLLPNDYFIADRTPVKASVGAGPTELTPFEIKTK